MKILHIPRRTTFFRKGLRWPLKQKDTGLPPALFDGLVAYHSPQSGIPQQPLPQPRIINGSTSTPSPLNDGTIHSGIDCIFNGTTSKIALPQCDDISTISIYCKFATADEPFLSLTSLLSISIVSSTITLTGAFPTSTIYVDGVPSATIIPTQWHKVHIVFDTPIPTSDLLVLGNVSTAFGDFSLTGFELWTKPFTQQEVTFDYNQPELPASSSNNSNLVPIAQTKGGDVIAYLLLIDDYSTANHNTILDVSQNNKHGIETDITWETTTDSITPQNGLRYWTEKIAEAITTSHVLVGNSPLFEYVNTDTFTIEASIIKHGLLDEVEFLLLDNS